MILETFHGKKKQPLAFHYHNHPALQKPNPSSPTQQCTQLDILQANKVKVSRSIEQFNKYNELTTAES